MNEQFKNRLKSFTWRVGMMALAALVDAIMANMNILQLTGVEVVLVGLFLGEVSKYLNKELSK